MNYSKGFGRGEHREAPTNLQGNREPSSHSEMEAGNFVKWDSSKLWISTIKCHPWATFISMSEVGLGSHFIGQHCPSTKTRPRHNRKRNQWPTSQINIDARILNGTNKWEFSSIIKGLYHHDQVGFISGMHGGFHIMKSIYVIHLTEWKEKKLHDRLIDTKKVSNIIQHPFIIKTFNKLRYREAASA